MSLVPTRMPRQRLARASAAGALFVVCWGLLHVGLFAREYHKLSGDVSIYQSYGVALRDGEVPYRDIAIDYPPGALPAFLPAAWPRGGIAPFELAMLACGVALVVLLALAGAGSPGLLLAGLSPLLIGDLLRTRFDLWPAALVTGAFVALLADRHRVGWALLGAAVAAKGYAICLLPVAAVWTARRRGGAELIRAGAWGAAVVAAAFVPLAVLAPHGMWVSVWGQLSRPLQVESLAGALLIAAGHPRIAAGHGSDNIAGAGGGVLGAAVAVVGLGVLVWCWVTFARGEPTRARCCRYAAASLCAFVAFGKVLSPQYLIWLLPLVALVPGRRGVAACGLFVAACLITHWWIPSRYYEYVLERRWSGVVLARDLVLVALAALLAWPAAEDAPERRRRAP